MGEKINIGNNVFVYPMATTIVGTHVKGKVNFMTVGFISRVNSTPPLIGISIAKCHYTPKGINKNKSFSVNFPSKEMMEVTDYCGFVSGANVDKSGLFDVFYGELDTAPMIAECPLNLECKLVKTLEFPTNYLFIGEIAGAYSEEQYMTDDKPDVVKMEPLVFTMTDNRYWTIGEYAGKVWECGKDFRKG